MLTINYFTKEYKKVLTIIIKECKIKLVRNLLVKNAIKIRIKPTCKTCPHNVFQNISVTVFVTLIYCVYILQRFIIFVNINYKILEMYKIS